MRNAELYYQYGSNLNLSGCCSSACSEFCGCWIRAVTAAGGHMLQFVCGGGVWLCAPSPLACSPFDASGLASMHS